MNEKQMGSMLNTMLKIVQTSYPTTIAGELFGFEVKHKPEERLSKKNIENYKTKLLVSGCACENCKFYKNKAARDPEWCQKQKYQPKQNICEMYETFQLDFFGSLGVESTSELIYNLNPAYDKKHENEH